MRINLPQCDLKTCRFFSDGNCLYRNEYEKCNYTMAKEYIHEVITGIIETLEHLKDKF